MSFDYLVKDFVFDQSIFNQIQADTPTYYVFPAIYILYCNTSKRAYIGETVNVLNRMKQHMANPDKNQLPNAKIIFSHYFNKSSVLDIEACLIQNMTADNNFKLLNGNYGIADHEYYQKESYQQTFKNIWDNLKFHKIVKHDLLDIQNSDLFKFSPYKSLSEDQHSAISEYLRILLSDTQTQSIFIEGTAGTGKTVLAIYIIKLLLTEIPADELHDQPDDTSLIQLAQQVRNKLMLNKSDLKIALVVPMTSLRKTLQKVFRSINGLSAKMVIGANEVSKESYDLLIIDESHRLKQRKNITGYQEFDKTNKLFGLDHSGTELDWILKSTKNALFFYDGNQSIRPSDIPQSQFDSLKNNSISIRLSSQMRVKGGENYIRFIDELLSSSPSIQPWESSNYSLKLFEYLPDMISELEKNEQQYGLCRMISGYSWKWISKNTNTADTIIDGVHLFWNRTNADWINSTTDMMEIGCIHTTQGYDLNFAGIIFGSDITFNKTTNRIETIKDNYHDRNGKAGIDQTLLHDYIINIYRTIMYRGIKGTYVYCYDKNLRDYFKQYIPLISKSK